MRIKWFSLVRVTGLLLVLLYHFFKAQFPGGFIGVDIFFTFSGFLITALIIDEYGRTESFDLLGFFKRRFYRIVPPLVLMVLVTIPFTFFVKPDFVADIGKQAAATLGFTTNWYEIFTGSSYESQFIPHLFVHTWSLAIEVHFYIIWAVAMWLLSKRQLEPIRFRGTIFAVSAVLFGLGFLSMFIRAFFTENLSLIYYSTISHSFAFFLGAIFATISGVSEATNRFKKNSQLWSTKRVILYFVGSFLMLLLLTFVLAFDNLLTFLFGFVLATLFASTMIYSARVLHEKTPNIKEPAMINFFADISYGLYLFHWPFYVIFSQLVSNWLAVLLTMFFSILFSSLSFYVLEPFIAGKQPKIWGLEFDLRPYWKILVGIGSALALLLVIVSAMAPKMGKFESDLLVNSLKQSQNNITRSYMVTAGDVDALSDVAIIGDSVALRSQNAFAEIMPKAQLDAAVSRNFEDAYAIFQNQADTGSLAQTVVIAVGVNSTAGYEEETQKYIDGLPKGHRLVFVTPYNAKAMGDVKAVRDYELKLARKYDYVEVADWYKAALDHPEIWGGTDGVHYSDADTAGADLYVTTVNKAVERVAKQPAKK
ncbi:acyltransferase family protein [Streptococcus hyovaginalis]|uniref:acyltransferase family protein n=1 Tax=Streptococcus hyovaginalis TaxID=149015 RepID=UPI001478DBE9|nr:acyltransferase family protein [Streptococcus hyovaginalis]